MKIAVTYENGNVFQHFGHTESFKLYEVNNKEIVKMQVVSSNGEGHGALAGVLSSYGVDVLICGGIGGGARNALSNVGIEIFGGVKGSADMAVIDYLNGKLNYDPNAKCDHHDHGEGHTCGDHSCH